MTESDCPVVMIRSFHSYATLFQNRHRYNLGCNDAPASVLGVAEGTVIMSRSAKLVTILELLTEGCHSDHSGENHHR